MSNAHLHPVFQLALAAFAPPSLHADDALLAQKLGAGFEPAANTPGLRPYIVRIGRPRQAPRRHFPVMAVDGLAAVTDHQCLCEPGERCEALPLGGAS